MNNQRFNQEEGNGRKQLQRPPQKKPDIHGPDGFGNPSKKSTNKKNKRQNRTAEPDKPTNEKRGFLSVFWRFVASFAFGLVFLGVVALATVSFIQYRSQGKVRDAQKILDDELGSKNPIGTDKWGSIFMPEVVNVLLLGVDNDGTRTDTMMAVGFYPKTGEIHIISLPRDTYTIMPPDRVDFINKNGSGTVSKSGMMKLNEVHHHAYLVKPEYGVEFIQRQVEDMLGIGFDYYAKINLDAFKFLVDEVGGIEFDVPRRMKYHDPYQDLTIDLEPGLQTLNGAQAEMVVRWRNNDDGSGYGDTGRMETQQAFLAAAISQLTSSKTIINNLDSYAKTAIAHMETNFNIAEMPRYLTAISRVSGDKIHTYMPEGHYENVLRPNGRDKTNVYIMDMESLSELADSIFYPSDSKKPTVVSSKGKSIQVANSTNISGFAASNREFLENEGFSNISIADYDETLEKTRIIVKKKGMGEDLLDLYTNAELVVDGAKTGSYDIVIILGETETNGLQVTDTSNEKR